MLMPSIFGENLFNDDWMDFSFPDVDKVLYGKHAKNVMKTDVKETDNSYEVDIDLPGFKKDEIEAKLENGYLTISAAKGLDKEEKDEKDGKYIRKERYSGAMSRSFYVGDELKQEDIKAKYEDGILKLSVPKKEQKLRPQSILLLKDKLNLNHLMRSRTGLWPGRLFKVKLLQYGHRNDLNIWKLWDAASMQVARTTVQRIYEIARKKIADSCH
jgi:HSP20 family protein